MLSLRIKRVAVTGGLAAGKSTVCRFFAECGAYVVSADTIVHELLELPSKVTEQVAELLGKHVLVNDKLDRGRIAHCVFSDPKLASALEELLHPHVRHALEAAYQACTQASYPLFVAEVPLLYEVGWEKDFDFIVVVLANRNQCRERFKKSFPGSSIVESDRSYSQRMARQMDPQEKAHLADCVLINETTDQDLQHAVQRLYQNLTS